MFASESIIVLILNMLPYSYVLQLVIKYNLEQFGQTIKSTYNLEQFGQTIKSTYNLEQFG